ncbi:hypothetical protein BDA99DRAFT_506925 [Phascolomyces articulosus]|uniref:Uncharacterized protein n=1 Tax=Phascolomyces articulosus TaxID=60185 RepID=A0AAD5KCJ3_9FUNG|nr:hypothetical protein BDA99DRAFT_506925 [Phascolomyces articulosus]
MSAFHFINATTKKTLSTASSPTPTTTRSNLTASLADDFFGDQFTSFVNQTPIASSSSSTQSLPTFERSSRCDNKPTTSNTRHAGQQQQQQQQRHYNNNKTISSSSSMKKSAFSFIGASSNIHLLDVDNQEKKKENEDDDDDDGSSTPRLESPKQSKIIHPSSQNNNNRKKKQGTNEMNRLSAETTWKRIQAEKEREKDKIQRCYNKRALIHEQMIQLQKEIHQVTVKSKEALTVEDYLQAQAFQTQQNKLTEKLWDVFSDTEDQVEQHIHACWISLVDLLTREMEAAKKLADACQHTKDDRERQLLKYHIDQERKYEERLQHIQHQRGKLDQEKSEIAFEQEMWEQSDAEFKSHMDELVHQERSKKEEVTHKMKNVQTEIDELMTRLGELQQIRDEYEEEIHQLDITIHDIMQPYLPEKEGLEHDHLLVQQRQQSIEKRWNQLDREDEILYREMEQHTKDKEREKNELTNLEEQIHVATQQLEQGQEEQEAIKTTFHDYVESRDALVIDKKQAMIRAHDKVTHGTQSIETKRRQLYTLQCGLEDQESVVQQNKGQLKSLHRQKKLAVETGQFQLAAEANHRIQSMESTLFDSETLRNDRQKQVDESLALLQKEQEQLEQLKKECMEIQHESGERMCERESCSFYCFFIYLF